MIKALPIFLPVQSRESKQNQPTLRYYSLLSYFSGQRKGTKSEKVTYHTFVSPFQGELKSLIYYSKKFLTRDIYDIIVKLQLQEKVASKGNVTVGDGELSAAGCQLYCDIMFLVRFHSPHSPGRPTLAHTSGGNDVKF